ncbi:hypothetical protein VNO77_25346 [Canavalia gladiata]|uniref:Uncharacterized protein n=1 Tax=Canavalia gladiata TaxID=3824 RepID=A0AAN9LAG3_CANGL
MASTHLLMVGVLKLHRKFLQRKSKWRRSEMDGKNWKDCPEPTRDVHHEVVEYDNEIRVSISLEMEVACLPFCSA